MSQATKPIKLVLIVAVLTVNCFVFLLLAFSLNEAKTQQEAEVRTTIEDVALLLENNISFATEKIDLSLREVRGELESALQSGNTLSDKHVRNLLQARRTWLIELAGFRVTDASGAVTYEQGLLPGNDRPLAGLALPDRRRADGLMVGNPTLSPASKTWIIAFSRRYNYPDGRFGGVILASVPVSYFARFLSELNLGSHGIALLRDAETAVIARYPPVSDTSQQVGTKVFSRELADIIRSGVVAATYYTGQGGDALARTNTYRRLTALPFHLVVGMAADDYLAPWRASATKTALVAAVFLIFTTILAQMLWRSVSLINKAGARSRLLLQRASDGIHIIDRQGYILEASDSFSGMLQYLPGEVNGMHVLDWDAQYSAEQVQQNLDEYFARQCLSTFETRHRRKDGSVIEVEVTSYRLELDGREVLYNSSRDITERKAADARIRQLSKLYVTLSQCNQAVVRCADEHALFLQVCRDAVTFGGMKMAWIGAVDARSMRIRSRAAHGEGADKLDQMIVSVDGDSPFGNGPEGVAFRENRSYYCQDFLCDHATRPWRDFGEQSGWAASAALPLHCNGTMIGTFSLFAGEAGAFDTAARGLLEEMALVISFALGNFVREAERKFAETALRESEARLRAMRSDHDVLQTESRAITAVSRTSQDSADSTEFSMPESRGFAADRAAGISEADSPALLTTQEKLAKANAHLAKLSAELIQIQEQERKNLAREMHDELGQRLTLLKISVHRMREYVAEPRALNTWERIDAEVNALSAQIRAMSGSLRPQALDYVGLESAVRQLLDNEFADAGIEFVFEFVGLPDKIEAPIDITAYRIVQEGVTNIVRHAQATQVVVEMNGGEIGDEMEVVVRDNGVGFDAGRIKSLQYGSVSSGLLGLRERIALLGGSIGVETSIGKGTRIVAILPLKGVANAEN